MIKRDIFIYSCLALLGVFGTGAITGLLSHEQGPRIFGYACVVLAAVAGAALLYMWLKAPAKASPVHLPISLQVDFPFSAADPKHPNREFLPPDVTPAVLMEKVRGRTSVQIAAIASTFVGKWMRVTAPIRDIAQATSETWLLFAGEAGNSENHFSAKFQQADFDRLMALNVGDIVTIVGSIDNITGSVGLTDCTIENIDRAPSDKKPLTKRSDS